MTDDYLACEIAWYAYECEERHPDTVIMIKSIEAYDYLRKRMAMAEVCYWYEKGHLPTWASVIERVDQNGDVVLFIHRDGRLDN